MGKYISVQQFHVIACGTPTYTIPLQVAVCASAWSGIISPRADTEEKNGMQPTHPRLVLNMIIWGGKHQQGVTAEAVERYRHRPAGRLREGPYAAAKTAQRGS